MSIRVLTTMILSLVATQAAFGATIASSQDAMQVVRVTNLSPERVTFEICTPKANNLMDLSHCQLIGSSEGYTAEDLERRIEDLKFEAKRDAWINSGIIVSGLIVGGIVGWNKPTQSSDTAPMVNNIFNAIHYSAVGSGLGVGLAVLKSKTLDGPASASAKTLHNSIPSISNDAIIMLNSPSKDIVRLLNYGLM